MRFKEGGKISEGGYFHGAVFAQHVPEVAAVFWGQLSAYLHKAVCTQQRLSGDAG